MLVGDGQLGALAGEAGTYGAATVFTSPTRRSTRRCRGPRVDVLAELVVQPGGFDTVLFSNSVLAADVAAGLAARLDAGINWDLVDLERSDGELVGKQPMLQDSVLVDVGWRSPQRVALFRPGSVRTGADVERRAADRDVSVVTFSRALDGGARS